MDEAIQLTREVSDKALSMKINYANLGQSFKGLRLKLSKEWESMSDKNGRKEVHSRLSMFNGKVVDSDCDVIASILDKGFIMDYHDHIGDGYTIESCLVLKGRIRYSFEDNDIVVSAGECVEIDATIRHRFESLDNSTIIITFKPKQNG